MPPQAKKFNAIDGFPVLDRRRNLFILTGAGISAESGLRTFRDGDGLWENHRIEDVATPEAFLRDPVLVQRFYDARRAQLGEVVPNAAHAALVELERMWEGEFTLVTQNVDDLHERAGSRDPIHMHGELKKARCLHSEQVFPWEADISADVACECCAKAGALRPHIVWFGEMPLFMESIYSALRRADIFIAIGTSGQVYPAAGFSMEARRSGAWTIECNLVSSESPVFETVLEDKATVTIPRLVELCA